MILIASILQILAALLTIAAIVTFLRSQPLSKAFLASATVLAGCAVLGAVAIAWTDSILLPFFFGVAGLANLVTGGKILFLRSKRWVHRFVIYSGYSATFLLMSVITLNLTLVQPPLSGWALAALLLGVYIVCSACIFAAKTLTVRLSPRFIPDYAPSAGADPWET